MIIEVNKNIRHLETTFFEEEDSEADFFYEKQLKDENLSTDEHNQYLMKLKDKSHITQYFCIPLSMNVMDLVRKEGALDKLVKA